MSPIMLHIINMLKSASASSEEINSESIKDIFAELEICEDEDDMHKKIDLYKPIQTSGVLEKVKGTLYQAITAPLKYKHSILSIDTQNFSQELKDKSKSEESEFENFNIMYNAKVQDNVNKKKGKISDKSRIEIKNAYMKMKKDAMWKLLSGKFVKEELYNLGKKLEFEHSVHFFIINTENEIIKQHFREYELKEIDNKHVPKPPDLSQDDKELRSKLQTIRIMHSELMMMVVYMNNLHGYVCRIWHKDIIEVLDNEENFSALLVIFVAILNAKIIV
ncbi:17190_t:CDS:2 [Cetraspora pellucida]|uniref:17190_t:CDS:1 n=1 Tax=Cetraspora pellucida TaxID=1433469 RepID=A0A9N9A135_9GLOM|nr:17190_t:CDS:2 [Cetraspora pellucida]